MERGGTDSKLLGISQRHLGHPSPPGPHCTCWLGWAEAETSSPPQEEGHQEAGESQEESQEGSQGSQGRGTGLPESCCNEVETDPAPWHLEEERGWVLQSCAGERAKPATSSLHTAVRGPSEGAQHFIARPLTGVSLEPLQGAGWSKPILPQGTPSP